MIIGINHIQDGDYVHTLCNMRAYILTFEFKWYYFKICDLFQTRNCTNVKCTHSSHKSRNVKRSVNKSDERARVLAGFKPKEDTQFKNILQQKMSNSGMDM